MTAIFIVCLPRSYIRVCAIPFCKLLHNDSAFGFISLMTETVMTARSKFAGAAFFVHGQHIGMAVDHPPWGGRCGCAKHHLQPRFTQNCDCLIEPFERILPRLWFKARPRKFTDAHPGEPRLCHPARILFPHRWGPVFGIITASKRTFHEELTI